MKISLIVAMTADRVIGINKQMPWHLPDDLRRFREITMGKPILMGRRTHESIGRALPGRENIILTHDTRYEAEGCCVLHSMADAIRKAGDQEIMVIGGSTLYEAFLPYANRLYLTLVEGHFKGDTYFPAFDPEEWRVSAQSPPLQDAASGTRFHYETLDRKQA